MRILLSVTYYRPHVSGLTIYVERLARSLVGRGHQVTVLTSQHDSTQPTDEVVDGVRVVRVPVIATLSKGPIMPRFGVVATRLVRTHDVVSLHLPQVESMLAAAPARAMGKPVVLTYHCDLDLPDGAFNSVIGAAVSTANRATGRLADAVVAYTDDYAQHSPFLLSFRNKIEVIGPPVLMPAPSDSDVAAFRARHQLSDGPILGFASRFATEKGIEYAIDAAPALIERYPDLRILFAGPYKEVIGEDGYRARLEPKIRQLGEHWQFLGTLKPDELPAFYSSLDALLMTSINSTESFGLVQVEAMLCGTPVVATDLPGVRQPVRTTGMGEIVDIASSASLTQGILKVLENRQSYLRPREEIAALYDINVTVAAYEALFERLIATNLRLSRLSIGGCAVPLIDDPRERPSPRPVAINDDATVASPFMATSPGATSRPGTRVRATKQERFLHKAGITPGREGGRKTGASERDFLAMQLAEMAPHRALLRAVECKFMSRVPFVHPVLDIGCGDGHFASIAYQEPIDVGLDPMDRDLKEAATRLPNIYLDIVQGSATALPFADASFATVVSNCVIEHIPDVDKTLSEISRVLRPGGIFATTLPSEYYPDFLLGSTVLRRIGLDRPATAYGDFFNRISYHYHVDPPEVWRERLNRAGLTMTDHTYYFSRGAHHAFDLAHYLGMPNLVAKRTLHRWVVHPAQMKPFKWWYRRYYDEPLPEQGAYQFVKCEKR